ncbi:MAG: hypothetical protein VB997_03660, partial [Opitutales bacterium]
DLLLQSLEAVGKQVYENVGGAEGESAAAGATAETGSAQTEAGSEKSTAKEEDIVEADFEVVDEDKDKS